MSKRYCFAVDLIDDERMMREYEAHHRSIWPEVVDGFHRAGIENVELYRTGNRLFMILDTDDQFSFEKKQRIDEADPVIRKWEELMSTYQQPLPWAKAGERWLQMTCIYQLR